VFKRRKFGFIEVQNENISFVSLGEDGGWHYLESIPLMDTFDRDNPASNISEKFKDHDFPLLIIPDFWFGNSRYPFHSRSSKIIRAFLARKLASEFPQASRIKDFFSYEVADNKKGEQEIAAIFLQEPKAYELYRFLVQNNIRPIRISSPALLWNERLRKRIDNFNQIGTGLIYLFDSRCSLYFYFRGNFLFSRVISLPEFQGDDTPQFEIITYEMNQSIYHFSQRTKTDLEKIFLYSGRQIETNQLSEMLGRDVRTLPSGPERRASLINQNVIIPVSDPHEILEPLKLPGVSDREAVNEIEQKKIQLIGIMIGLAMLIILGLEFSYLTGVRDREALSLSAAPEGPTQSITQYNEALDVLLNKAGEKNPMDMVGRLIASLPENILVESIVASADPSPAVSLSGIIKAYGADDFSNSLRSLIERVNINVPAQNPLTMNDVDIEIKGDYSGSGYQDYHISFTLDII
jgi:hypothetical protein